jgi:hypothetical protein
LGVSCHFQRHLLGISASTGPWSSINPPPFSAGLGTGHGGVKYVINIPGKDVQKTAVLSTAHILRKVPMYRYNRFNTETNDISTMNSTNRIAATLFSLGT